MKSLLVACLLFSLLLFFTGALHAEGGCPAGMIPYSGNDINSCGPVPANYYSNQQQQTQSAGPSPAQWTSKSGAIATDPTTGALGTATDLVNQREAEQAALADCQSKGGSVCKVDIAYSNGCAAMVAGATGYNTKSGQTTNDAIQAAMKVCSAATKHCYVYYSGCSLPVRIQ